MDDDVREKTYACMLLHHSSPLDIHFAGEIYVLLHMLKMPRADALLHNVLT